MLEQQNIINAKKEEAKAKEVQEVTNKVNVLDIDVEDNFEIDDIWATTKER